MDRSERRAILGQVYAALEEEGYSPPDQIMGYILTGKAFYITNHNGARKLIQQINRKELAQDLLLFYISPT